MLGSILDGRYQIQRQLGEGGMGTVYEAEHTGTGRRVAVKVITAQAVQSASAVARLQREARAAGAIDSANVAQIFDCGKDPATGHPYLVMELLLGEDTSQLVARTGPLPPDLALRVVAQACVGLQKAHGARVMHRDIKPANLFLARRDEGEITVKLLDFGIAKIKMDEAATGQDLTRTNSMLGSPLYMSPEQSRGLRDIDFRTDIWSLGVVLYMLLAGRTPCQECESLGELLLTLCSEPARPVQDFAPWVRPEVAALTHRALQLNRADRFQSAAAMLEAMKPLLPDGFAIREEMLVPLGAEARGVVAARFEATAPGAGGALKDTAQGPPIRWTNAFPPSFDDPPAGTSPGSAKGVVTTRDRTAVASVNEVAGKTSAEAAAPSRPRWLSAMSAILVAAVATVGVLAFARRPAEQPVVAAPALSASGGGAAEPPVAAIDPERLASFSPLPAVAASTTNPLTEDKIKLGRMLFYDARLSKNQDHSCNSCHALDKYGMDGARVSTGHANQMGTRNALSVYNASGYFALLWDGQGDSVEEQAKLPMVRPNEMGMSDQQVEATLRSIPEYVKAFARAFPSEKPPLSFTNAARAIGAFERKLFTPGRWDKFLSGDKAALSSAEKAGFNDFLDAGCASCHFGPYVGATMFQKAGLLKAWPNTKDRGRFELTQKDTDYMVFRVPSLRNVAATAPYFHDGSISSLEEAIRMMAWHQLGKELPPAKIASIATWLATLTGELPREYVEKPALPESGPSTPRPRPE